MKKKSSSQKILHQATSQPKVAAPIPKPEKRDNVFSQSRDVREDRGTRAMKTGQNPQSSTSTR